MSLAPLLQYGPTVGRPLAELNDDELRDHFYQKHNPHSENTEHQDSAQILRDRNEWLASRQYCIPIDLEAVNRRLAEKVEGHGHGQSEDTTAPEPTWAAQKALAMQEPDPKKLKGLFEREKEERQTLVRIGGRPTHTYEQWLDGDEGKGIERYAACIWHSNWASLFSDQIGRWHDFQWWQAAQRADSSSLPSHQLRVASTAQRYKLGPFPDLHNDPERQDKLSAWAEYLCWEDSLHTRPRNDRETAEEHADWIPRHKKLIDWIVASFPLIQEEGKEIESSARPNESAKSDRPDQTPLNAKQQLYPRARAIRHSRTPSPDPSTQPSQTATPTTTTTSRARLDRGMVGALPRGSQGAQLEGASRRRNGLSGLRSRLGWTGKEEAAAGRKDKREEKTGVEKGRWRKGSAEKDDGGQVERSWGQKFQKTAAMVLRPHHRRRR